MVIALVESYHALCSFPLLDALVTREELGCVYKLDAFCSNLTHFLDGDVSKELICRLVKHGHLCTHMCPKIKVCPEMKVCPNVSQNVSVPQCAKF